MNGPPTEALPKSKLIYYWTKINLFFLGNQIKIYSESTFTGYRGRLNGRTEAHVSQDDWADVVPWRSRYRSRKGTRATIALYNKKGKKQRYIG